MIKKSLRYAISFWYFTCRALFSIINNRKSHHKERTIPLVESDMVTCEDDHTLSLFSFSLFLVTLRITARRLSNWNLIYKFYLVYMCNNNFMQCANCMPICAIGICMYIIIRLKIQQLLIIIKTQSRFLKLKTSFFSWLNKLIRIWVYLWL